MIKILIFLSFFMQKIKNFENLFMYIYFRIFFIKNNFLFKIFKYKKF